jgi:hypothetical protein
MPQPDRTSRYFGLATIAVPAGDGGTRILGVPRVTPRPATKGTYEVRAGDRLDLLGQAATGDSTRWWVLADANPFADATELERPGLTIDLPDA